MRKGVKKVEQKMTNLVPPFTTPVPSVKGA